MRWFCTYFDKNYLVRGLALYNSLTRHCPDFRLCVICLDKESHNALTRMNLPGMLAFGLEDLEQFDPDLLVAKNNRNLHEYYYTLTPIINLFIFQRIPEVDLVTYLDSDLYFFGSPEPLFEELGSNSISIIGHRFPSNLLHLAIHGIYNVAWLTFRRDANGMECLQWWRERCLEWCYERVEETRFADQKYLDDWPDRFSGVIVLQHKGANVAQWNLSRYNVTANGSNVLIDDQPLLFFHFHRFRRAAPFIYDANLAAYGASASHTIRQSIFKPYVRAISAVRSVAIGSLPDNALGLGVREKGIGFVGWLKYTIKAYQRALKGDFIFIP
jgi:hypothetical protein